MEDLLQIIDNEPRVSHRLVAQSTGNQVKAITQLISKYENEFTEFGGTPPFKMEGDSEIKLKQKENPDYRPNKTYYLNEPQATFLMTLLRNKPIVVEFKKKLVKAFYEMKGQAQSNLHVELDQLIPAVKTMVNMMSMMLQSQTKMMEMMQELMNQQAQTKNLTPEQLGKLRGAINLAAVPIGEFFSQSSASEVKKCIYTNLNNRLGVPSYIYIPNHAMDEAITFISHLEDKYIAKNKNVEDMNVDIYKESKV